jgi:hypothetical protein
MRYVLIVSFLWLTTLIKDKTWFSTISINKAISKCEEVFLTRIMNNKLDWSGEVSSATA